MKQFFAIAFTFLCFIAKSQNLIFDDYSTYNVAKLDGQNGYSTATPNAGNGTGACGSVSGCIYAKIINMTMTYPSFGSPTRALICSDSVSASLHTQDGPGKSLGSNVTSGSVYVAVLVNCYQQSGIGTNKQIIRLMDNSVNVPCRILVKNATTAGEVNFGIAKTGSGTTWSQNSYSTNQDHLLILKYEYKTGSTSNDAVSLFVDPDMSLPEPTATSSINGNSDATSITRVVFPWNANSNVFNGYIGITSVAQSWATIVPQANPTYNITGRIITPIKKNLVLNTKVKYSTNQSKDSVVTAANGAFTFSNLSTNDYTIKCSKLNETTKANGVNASDVLFIQRHILGTTKLNNAYKIIAADVDGNKIINATDVLRIKRFILGTDTTFKHAITNENRTWVFVDSSFVFADTTNPFPFKDSISITGLSSNQTNKIFMGIKLGDVDFNWNPAVAKGVKHKPVSLLKRKSIYSNTYNISIAAHNFTDMATMQLTLHFDNENFELLSINNNALPFDFNTQTANKTGNIGCLWVNGEAKGKTLPSHTDLFTITLKPKNSKAIEPLFSITNDLINIQAISNDLELMKMNFNN